MEYIPIADRVLIRPKDKITESQGGLILTEADYKQEPIGEVIAIGDGIPLFNIKLNIVADTNVEALTLLKEIVELIQNGRKMRIKVGDTVQYGQYAGTNVVLDGVQYIMIREGDVFGIIRGGGATIKLSTEEHFKSITITQ